MSYQSLTTFIMPGLPPLILLSLLGTLALLYVVQWLLRPNPLPNIPHNEITSVWADIPALAKAKVEHGAAVPHFFEASARKLGPIYQVLFGPFAKALVISDAQALDELSLSGNLLEQGAVTGHVLGGTIQFSQVALPTNEIWKKQRKLATPSMSTQNLKRMTPRIVANVQGLVNYWGEKTKLAQECGASAIDVNPDFLYCTMDTIGEVAIGETFHGIDTASNILRNCAPIIDEDGGGTFPHIHGTILHDACHYLFKRIGDAFQIPPPLLPIFHFYNRYFKREWRSQYNLIKDHIKKKIAGAMFTIAERRRMGEEDSADSILEAILERRSREELEDPTEMQMVIDEVLGFIIAGQDSTASALGFGVKYLTNHPQVQLKLRNELLTQLDSPDLRPLTYEDVASTMKLPYLESVVAEILRCASVGGIVTRQTQEDTIILGKAVPKGTNLYLLTGFAGLNNTRSCTTSSPTPRREKHSRTRSESGPKPCWEDDAGAFKPERWLVEQDDGMGGRRTVYSAKQGVSMPFGLGHRACFGQKLAILEMKIFIATLVLNFFFAKIPEKFNKFDALEVMTLQPKHCYISLKTWDEVDVDTIDTKIQ